MFAVFVGLSSYNNQTIEFLVVSSGRRGSRCSVRAVIGPAFILMVQFTEAVLPFETSASSYPGHLLRECEKKFDPNEIFQRRVRSKLSVAPLQCPFSSTKKDSCNIDAVDKNPHFSLSLSPSHTSGKVSSKYSATVAPSNCATQNKYCPK
jgi:hypothetical protein